MKILFLELSFAALCTALLAACGGSSGNAANTATYTVPGAASDSSVYDAQANTLTDLRDGQVYRTTTIAPAWRSDYSEVWMASNLNYKTEGSYCYGDESGNCSKYGRLYTWKAALKVCPAGWHLPSMEEFESLLGAVAATRGVVGEMLKSTSGWKDGGNGEDVLGFSALPAGDRNIEGYFDDEGDVAHFWNSTEYASNYALDLTLLYDSDGAALLSSNEIDGFSVRCLKD